MLLKLKNLICLAGLVTTLSSTAVLQAGECGVFRYVPNKSTGVTIKGNSCDRDDVALGSEFDLIPGARLWFKSHASGDSKKIQGICQSRSSENLHITVANDKQPWIKPTGTISCDAWANNKINCSGSKGEQNALSCYITVSQDDLAPSSTQAKVMDDRTTSVRMRSLQALAPQIDKEAEKQRIIAAMQTEFGLCNSLKRSDAQIKITWLVEANSKVDTVIPAANSDNIPNDKNFIECLTAVIKDYPYPQSDEPFWLSARF
ncbi:MAG: hypothetical protein K9L60_10335 [Methylovulum sp.]|jgi:hypothetical protein|nr:hypothetical protein [Methylovulum sp.]MCF7999526.1 hypothetical protein [Methylovulum sp.]